MSASGVSIVEWSAVKWPGRDADAQNALVPETLNCWGTGVDYQPLSEYRISTTFSPVPEHLLVNGRLTLASVELLLASSNSAWASNATDSSHWEQTPPPPPPRAPGVRVACFQHLFSMYSIRWRKGIAGTFAIPEDFSLLDPQWREVGQHLRFNDHIRAVGDALLAAVLGSTTTPFIGVHLRQGDFLRINRTSTSTEDYQDAVLAVDKELRQRLLLRYRTLPVVVATDSEDPQYHAKIKALDWRLIDHTAFNTSARYSPWYPGVLDAYILSKSIGFVGYDCGLPVHCVYAHVSVQDAEEHLHQSRRRACKDLERWCGADRLSLKLEGAGRPAADVREGRQLISLLWCTMRCK